MAKRKVAPRTAASLPVVLPEQVDRSILVVRGHKVLLDSQLASFYGVLAKSLVQAVKRNLDRFPSDFIFQRSDEEWDALRSQFVTLKTGRGQHRKYPPYAFNKKAASIAIDDGQQWKVHPGYLTPVGPGDIEPRGGSHG